MSLHPSSLPYCFLVSHSLPQWLTWDTEGVSHPPTLWPDAAAAADAPVGTGRKTSERRTSASRERSRRLQDDLHAVVSADDPDLAGGHLGQAGGLEGEQHGTLAEVHVEPAVQKGFGSLLGGTQEGHTNTITSEKITLYVCGIVYMCACEYI